jgi:hypothetical protein
VDIDSTVRGRRRGHDGGAVVKTAECGCHTLAERIERECLCGCGHDWSDHLPDGNGYQVCWHCPSPFDGNHWWGCVIDRGGYYGIAPVAYVLAVESAESPDAYRWSPE